MMAERAELFAAEAKEANLAMLPYIAGFFLSIRPRTLMPSAPACKPTTSSPCR
jgi:hypothetical protein